MSGDLIAGPRPEHPRHTPVPQVAAWLAQQEPALRAEGESHTEVTGLCLNSQRVKPGDLYCALPGSRVHGASFVADAVSAGAVAVLTDPVGAELIPADLGLPVWVAPRPRALLGGLAAFVYGNPAQALRMIGVTGTQGKTTTTRLAEAALQASGVTAAVIGTVGTRVADADLDTALTTPEAPDLHGLFAVMVEHAVAACVMEVSSHALVLGRVDGVVFDVAVFLNLGRDHLDFHADTEDYFAAKLSLFRPERARLGLTNVDDEYGQRVAREATVPMRTFSARGAEADWQALDVVLSPEGSTFTLRGPGNTQVPVSVPLPGDFNVANAVAAIAACAEAGFDPASVARAMAASAGVPGRLERIDAGQDFVVVVDYAHKPDAIEAALQTLRPLTQGQLIVVLGAGGDRDAGKRPLMGEIAGRLADVLVVTDDNPRSEDPAEIRAALLAGAYGARATVLEIGDRRAAIREALARAEPGDIVVVAGKGHETGQEIAGVRHEFDDRVVVREELAAR